MKEKVTNGVMVVRSKVKENPWIQRVSCFLFMMMVSLSTGATAFAAGEAKPTEEPQEREKRKQSLKTAIIGFVLIFVLIVALRLSLPILTEWMTDSSKGK